MNEFDSRIRTQVAIVGGGPSGAACAYWLAMKGIETTLVEKKSFPRDKTCGDGLTPRSVVQLEAMGLGSFLQGRHRYEGLRVRAYGRSYEIPWPTHPDYPGYGYVVPRRDLDAAVLDRAREVGAAVLMKTEAVHAHAGIGSIDYLVLNDLVSGSSIKLEADYYILAEGSNARIARSIGATRDTTKPLGLAIRGYYGTSRSKDPWIESHLDVRNKDGDIVPGYGWIFPVGDGSANVGFGILTNRSRWRKLNTTTALDDFVAMTRSDWDYGDATKPVGGKLQMGLSVTPVGGRNFLVVGDSAATINPFNGEGISYAYETGRLAASLIEQALGNSDMILLARYQERLSQNYRAYYAVADAFVRLISEPRLMSSGVWLLMRSPWLMNPMVSIMANLMQDATKRKLDNIYRVYNKAKELAI